jgi:hypothetical protein
MEFKIADPEGAIIGVVSPTTRMGDDEVGHIHGDFVEGPAFGKVRDILDAFEPHYRAGDWERAAAVHAEIDRMSLIATRDDGRRYLVSNVYHQGGKLLFFAVLKEAWDQHGGFPGSTLIPPR